MAAAVCPQSSAMWIRHCGEAPTPIRRSRDPTRKTGISNVTLRPWVSALVAICVALGVETGSSVPEQIHISFGGDYHSMVVMWASRDPANGTVWYGTSAENMASPVEGAVSRLPTEDYKACNYVHRAELQKLSLNTRYVYKVVSVGADDSRRESRVYGFRTLSQSQVGVVRYLVYGDMGVYTDKGGARLMPTFRYLQAAVETGEYTAVWHVGDIAYDLFMDKGQIGDDFLRHIQPVAANIPYMTAPGNHEKEQDFIHYRTRFSYPGVPWPIPLNKLWYSYDIGVAHFISYSTEVYFTDNEDYVCDQFYWLLQDLILANCNREKTPWIIAMGHRPMYCSNIYTMNDCTKLLSRWVQHGLEDLFYAQGVDLVIEAHEHSYERLFPVYNDRVYNDDYKNPDAPVHVISGAAGNYEGSNRLKEGAKWSAFRADTGGWLTVGHLEIHNKTHIYFEEREVSDNTTLDNFWLVQTNHGPFVGNVSCSGPVGETHRSCTCPTLYRYLYYRLVVAAVGALLAIIALLLCYMNILHRIVRDLWKMMRRTRVPTHTHSNNNCDHNLLVHTY